MGRIVLITGGARSGKSAHALSLAGSDLSRRLFFVATAEARDSEMTARIARHKASRSAQFQTIEEPLSLVSALARIEGRGDAVVVDCLTLWLSNLIGAGKPDDAILAQANALAATLARASFSSIIVSGEVGAGVVSENPVARRFCDLLGWTTQKIAQQAGEVIMMIAGCPLRVK